MKIAYDGMPFEHNWIEGMLVYNRQLLDHMLELYPEHEYSFFFNSLRQDFANVNLPGKKGQAIRSVLRVPSTPWPEFGRKLYFDFALPRRLRKEKVDIFHGLRYYVPPAGKTKVVTTFHDIFALVIPDTFQSKTASDRNMWYKRAVERSDAIIAVSGATKDDLMRMFNLSEKRIKVVHEAAGSIFKPVTEQDELTKVRKKYSLDYKYLFALASHPVRKNTENILRAMSQLIKQDKCNHKLVFFGGGDARRKQWTPLMQDLGIENDVVFLQNVPTEDLPALYSMADIYLYPSLYEGFGIPILEAMGCGTPVITSNLSAMPEVAGDAGLLVDPKSVDELGKAISSLLSDSEKRKKLSELGQKQAKKYSWERTARETMAVYESLV